MKALQDVLQHFANSKAALEGKARKSDFPDHVAIFETLPNFFNATLRKHGRESAFKVEGSIGAGNIANVPWVAIFNKDITESAQNGYYIVLLFSEDMSSCYLSLNQGVTAFKKMYSSKVAREKIIETAARALQLFTPYSDTTTGPINLVASGDLGKGYERGAIESYFYGADHLPNADELERHFLLLLKHYDDIFNIAKKSLESLAPVSEGQYQQAIREKASKRKRSRKKYKEPSGSQPPPPKYPGSANRYQRNPDVATLALEKAEFQCEIDSSHETFQSKAKGLPYVEAHHLIPMSKQSDFDVSLDVSANIIALCPLCHKLLHHGLADDKKPHLVKLLKDRKGRLQEKGIKFSIKALMKVYGGELEEEA